MQCNKEFESDSNCESDAEGKVLRISHALKFGSGHYRFMEPSRKQQLMLRDAHAKRIDMLRILKPLASQPHHVSTEYNIF